MTEETNTDVQSMTELRILPDGRILAHNLTPAMAALLAELDPDDTQMQQRACEGNGTETEMAAGVALALETDRCS